MFPSEKKYKEQNIIPSWSNLVVLLPMIASVKAYLLKSDHLVLKRVQNRTLDRKHKFFSSQLQ